MHRTCLAVLVSVLLSASCAPPAVDLAALREAIDSHNAASAAAMIAGKPLDGVLAYYAEDAIEMPPSEPLVRGKEAIHQRNATLMQSGIRVKSMRFTPTNVQAANDVAYEVGTIECTGSLGDGLPDVDYTGKYIVLWKRQPDGAWRITADIWNADAPMPGLPTDGSSVR
jgi:ketosteroid isomerase-like protein